MYNGLTMDASDLGGNRYISFSLSGVIEIPSYVAAFVLVDRYGNRVLKHRHVHALHLCSSVIVS